MKKIVSTLMALVLTCQIFAQTDINAAAQSTLDYLDYQDHLRDNPARDNGFEVSAIVNDMNERDLNHVADAIDVVKGEDPVSSSVSTGLGHINDVMDFANNLQDQWNNSPPLDANECVPDFTQDMSNELAYACNEEDQVCEQCFTTAVEKINFYRRQLSRLHCIYVGTKAYKESAVAFGDNTSGIHAMAGMAWQKERANINKTFQQTQSIYDNKSTEFLTGLQAALRELSSCMSSIGDNNWYAKSGFIYFEFMQEKYKRND